MGHAEMNEIAGLIDTVLNEVNIVERGLYQLAESVRLDARARVQHLCARFPLR